MNRSNFKTVLCRFYTGAPNSCRFGPECRFAHGVEDLRIVGQPLPLSAPAPGVQHDVRAPGPAPSLTNDNMSLTSGAPALALSSSSTPAPGLLPPPPPSSRVIFAAHSHPPPPPPPFYNPFQHGFPRPPLLAHDGNGGGAIGTNGNGAHPVQPPFFNNPYAQFVQHGHGLRYPRKPRYVITVLKANFEVEQSVTLADPNEAIACFRKLFEDCVVPATFSAASATLSCREFCYAGFGTRAAIITGLSREGGERALHELFNQKEKQQTQTNARNDGDVGGDADTKVYGNGL